MSTTYRILWHQPGQNGGYWTEISADTIQDAAWEVALGASVGGEPPQLVNVQELPPAPPAPQE